MYYFWKFYILKCRLLKSLLKPCQILFLKHLLAIFVVKSRLLKLIHVTFLWKLLFHFIATCYDSKSNCQHYKDFGWCDRKKAEMVGVCPVTCNLCRKSRLTKLIYMTFLWKLFVRSEEIKFLKEFEYHLLQLSYLLFFL